MKPGGLSIALRRAISIGLLLALAVPGLASAQHQGRPGRGGQQQQKQQGAQRPVMPPSERPREATFRERQQQQQPHGRMSDEERQQLRRDISDHGRDIYRDRSGQRQ